MEKGKIDHPCQAGVATLLACSMPMIGVGIGEGLTAGKLDSSVCLSGCPTQDDGYMVNDSIAMAT